MKTPVSTANDSIAAGELTDIFTQSEEKRYVQAGLAEYVTKKAPTKAKNKK